MFYHFGFKNQALLQHSNSIYSSKVLCQRVKQLNIQANYWKRNWDDFSKKLNLEPHLLVTGSGLSYFGVSSKVLTLSNVSFRTMRPFQSLCKHAVCERHAQSLVSQCYKEQKKTLLWKKW